ncbi:hypothetical protein [Paenibacillus illinoisensis]|uniref:hypothetical protein n=1 Tax=Paenibacillus illinoisensis TaxID=59845 RepID=UPI0030159EFE
MIKVGDIVRNKTTGEYGTVHFSSFGVSIHMWSEELNGLVKTLGFPASSYSEDWETVDMPEGYELAKYGGLIKKDKE